MTCYFTKPHNCDSMSGNTTGYWHLFYFNFALKLKLIEQYLSQKLLRFGELHTQDMVACIATEKLIRTHLNLVADQNLDK